MKLLRFGAKGLEKPGLLDADGQTRGLSEHVSSIAGEALSPNVRARPPAPGRGKSPRYI